MPRACVICTEQDSEAAPLLELPCFNHWVCRDGCIEDFFEKATWNESLYPPQCCDEPILLDRFEDYVPKPVQDAFRLKEQGEYTILPKHRVYCANPICSKFIHPNGHIKDTNVGITYAICESENCFQATCCGCKALLPDGIDGHVCKVDEEEQKFKEAVNEKGYKECSQCGATVELAEACNHITCSCGNNFCYICGKSWTGMHGCPQYGPAQYDDEGYNQDGFHRDTGLNRDGRTRREEAMHNHGQDEEDGEEEQEEPEPEIEDLWDQILHHVDPQRRATIENLPPDEREDAMMQLQIELIDRGIVFDVPQPHDGGGGHDEEHDAEQEAEHEDGNWADQQEEQVDALFEGANQAGHHEPVNFWEEIGGLGDDDGDGDAGPNAGNGGDGGDNGEDGEGSELLNAAFAQEHLIDENGHFAQEVAPVLHGHAFQSQVAAVIQAQVNMLAHEAQIAWENEDVDGDIEMPDSDAPTDAPSDAEGSAEGSA